MTESPRACILSVSGPALLSEERALLRDLRPWGVILMGRSCVSPDQVRGLVEDIWAALERPALIFIDQEGGRVARLKPPHWPGFPTAAAFGRLAQSDPVGAAEAAWLSHRLMAHELAVLFIHADCAPVLDLPVAGAHDVIGDRAFAPDADTAIPLARAALKGLRDGGVAGVIKHLPGHGRSRADSHMELPVVEAGLNELSAKDFRTFEALRDAPMAMTAHIAFSALDPGVPATLSPNVISQVIRGRIGFEGLLMSDDLGMKALGGPMAERTRRARAAGCDVALHCAGFARSAGEVLAEMREVGEAALPLDGPALERAVRAEAATGHASPFDVEAGWARLRELLPEWQAAA